MVVWVERSETRRKHLQHLWKCWDALYMRFAFSSSCTSTCQCYYFVRLTISYSSCLFGFQVGYYQFLYSYAGESFEKNRYLWKSL